MAKSADAFRTISEVADWLGVQTHVLRFWESKFTQVKPVKRAGGRRYYRPVDMLLLGGIRKLLHEDGLTIKGVQKILREKGMAHVSALSPVLDGVDIEVPKPLPKIIAKPVESIETEAADPETADVVPFMEPETTDFENRPSFTQDAVVMPETTPIVTKDVIEPDTGDEAVQTAASLEQNNLFIEEPADISTEVVENQEGAADETSHIEVQSGIEAETASAVEDGISTEIVPEIETPLVAENNVALEAEIEGHPADATQDDPVIEESADDPQEVDLIQEKDVIATQSEVVEEVPPVVETTGSEVLSKLPSFLNEIAPAATPSDDLSSETAEGSLEEAAQPEETPQAKPNIIDIPDAINESEVIVSARLLTALSHTRSFTPEQAEAVAPLLAQLRETRDRITQARKE